jgi:hypothetical protein
MYWAIAAFNFIVALICSTVIAAVSLFMLTVGVVLLQNSRKAKNGLQGGK